MTEHRPDPASDNSDQLFPIRTVSSVTGVNPITLRAWERRYGLVNPKRTDTGHRLYSQQDVDRIAKAVSLLETGMSISQACNVISRKTTVTATTKPSGEWQVVGKRLMSAVARFSEHDLNDMLLKLLSRYPAHVVVDQLLLPTLEKLREKDTPEAAAHAAYMAMYARTKLGARFHHRQKNPSGPAVLGLTFPGKGNEIALLSFGFAAHEAGFRPVLIGPPSQLVAIAHVARVRKCDAVVMALHKPPTDEVIDQLAATVSRSPAPIFALGAGAQRAAEALTAAGVNVLDGNARSALGSIRSNIDHRAQSPVAAGQV